MKRIFYVSALLFLALPASGWADVVKLKDGSEMTGKIVKRDAVRVVMNVDGLEVTIPGETIQSVDGQAFTVDPQAAYEEELKSLDDTNADSQYRMGKWCEAHGLAAKAKEHIKKALDIDPKHEGANLALGRVYVDKEGQWMDRAEARKKGYTVAKSSGKWVTEDEAAKDIGLKEYKGYFLSDEEIKRMKEREYSQWQSYYSTHAVCDLKDQIRRIALFNKLGLSKEQMDALYVAVAEADDARQMFLETRHEVNAKCEEAWNRLKEENMKGVYRSFDTPASVEGPAAEAEKAYKHLPKGYSHILAPYLERVEKILAQTGARTAKGSQLFKVDHDYCMCCHRDMAGNSECATCHTGTRKEQANPAAIKALKEARAMSGADWVKKKDDVMRTWIKPVTAEGKKEQKMREAEERASVERIFTQARDLDATAFENSKTMLAAQLGASGDIERARIEAQILKQRLDKMARSHETEGMMMDCFFDGTMLEILGGKVKKPKELLASAKRPTAGLVEKQAVYDGKQMMEQACVKCHTLDRVHRRIREAPRGAEWGECVRKMLLPLPPEVRAAGDVIADYLMELEGKDQTTKKDEF